MNKLTIIGNLTKDPELRTTTSGKSVCDFTVAVNRRNRREGEPEADFFRCSVWNQMGEACAKYLAKGRKVCVIGSVSVRTYTTQNGEARASLEVAAQDVEFLSSRNDNVDQQTGYTKVDTDENPFNEQQQSDLPY